MCLTQFYTAEKTIAKLLFTSSRVLSLRGLPPFTPSTSKWYFASTEQNLNRGRLSLVLNLEHTNLSNCQAYWNVFFPILSNTYVFQKKKNMKFFFYYEVSLRHCIITYGIPCVRLWCIVLSACCQCTWCQYPTPQKQFIIYSYSIYCPWLYAFQIFYLQSLKEQREVNHKNYPRKNMQFLSFLISEHIEESAVSHWSLEGDGKLGRKSADWSRHMEDMKMSESGRRRERTLKTRGHVGGFTHCQQAEKHVMGIYHLNVMTFR